MLINPFSNSRVDNPFQDHIDLDSLNHQQFARLEAILKDIKNDHNHQTKGAVIIGDAGSGKTHLIMRLAKTHLKSNRLLFIRCPTNPDGVTYHIYSRILESLMEMVDNRYNQLDYLIAKSFGNIIKQFVSHNKLQYTESIRNIISITEQNPLDIFEKFGIEGTEQNKRNWLKVENIFTKWNDEQDHSSKSSEILKAFVKQTRYKDLKYRGLIKYYLYLEELDDNDLKQLGLSNLLIEENREELALKAIETLARLSLMDEPLIIVFDQLELLGESYNRNLLLNFGSVLREIFTHVPNSLIIINLFPDRWAYFKSNLDSSIIERVGQSEVLLEKPHQSIIKEIIEKRSKEAHFDISVFQKEDWDKILMQTTIRGALNWASNYYRFYVEQVPLPFEFKSFEEEIREELIALKQRISNLEQHLISSSVEIPELEQPESPLNIQTPIIEKTPQLSVKKHKDEDLIKNLQDYMIQRQLILEQNYDKPTIIDDNDDIGKVRLILENFKELVDFELDVARLGKSVLPANIEIHTKQWVVVIGFLQVTGTYFTNRIKHFNELVINNKDFYFRLYRDIRQPQITGKVGKEEIEKLNNSKKGKFIPLEKDQRIQLELFYQLISDIINRDQDFPLKETLKFLKTHYRDHFLMKILFGTRHSF